MLPYSLNFGNKFTLPYLMKKTDFQTFSLRLPGGGKPWEKRKEAVAKRN